MSSNFIEKEAWGRPVAPVAAKRLASRFLQSLANAIHGVLLLSKDTIQDWSSRMDPECHLVGGFNSFNPPEKYESQIGSSSQLLGKIKFMFQTTNQP